jgi:transcriptional regulator with XRE-family HTH domain
MKELRKEKGVLQSEVAAAVGVTGNTIGNWETGTREPNHEKTAALAKYFGVTIDYLLGASDDRYYRHSWESNGHTYETLSTDNKNAPTPQEREDVENAEFIEVPFDDLPKYGLSQEDIRRIVQEEIRRNNKG